MGTVAGQRSTRTGIHVATHTGGPVSTVIAVPAVWDGVFKGCRLVGLLEVAINKHP